MKKEVNIVRLKKILEEKGIQGKILAADLGLTAATISNTANGKSLPRPENLLRIANYLNVDLRELFVSTKKTNIEPVYVKRGDAYIALGSVDIEQFKENQNPQR